MTKPSNLQLVVDHKNIAGFQIMVCGHCAINLLVQVGAAEKECVSGAIKRCLTSLFQKPRNIERNLGFNHLIC